MPTRAPTYALIVGDRTRPTETLKHFIETLAVVDRVLVAASHLQLELVIAERGRPRIALVDLGLHTARSTALIRQLQHSAPQTRVMLVGEGDGNAALLEAAHALGAQGCFGLGEPPRVHRAAVLAVLAGRTWFGDLV